MDVVLQSHQEVARFNAVCDICHTRCDRSSHFPVLSVYFKTIVTCRCNSGERGLDCAET